MSSHSAPRNRKERRAVANASSSPEILLAQPDRTTPKHKTLYDLAAERNAKLSGGQPFAFGGGDTGNEPALITTTLNPDGSLSLSESNQTDEDPIGHFGNALIFAVTLTMLHFTFDVLVHNQYRQAFDWNMIMSRTFTTFPLMFLLIFMLHPRAKTVWVQAVFFVGSVMAGCYLIWASSEEPYFAVMRKAPPVGTLWIWSVLEMKLEIALVSLGFVGGYFWWGEYTIF